MKSKIMLRLLPDDRYLAEASKEEPVWIGYYPSTPHYIPLDSTDATPAGFYDMVKLKYESSRYQNNKEDEQETVNMRDMVGKDDKTGHGQGTNEMWTTVVKRGKRDSADMKRRATDNTEKTLSEFTETTLENAGKIDNLVALHSAIYLSRQPKKPNETNVVEKKKKAKFTSHKYFMRNEEAKQWTKFLKEQDEGAEQHFKDERSKKVDEKANMEQEEEQEKKRKRKHEKRKANTEPKVKNAENDEDIKTEVEEVKGALIWRRRAIRKRKAMRKRSRKRRRQAAAKRRSWFRKQARQIKQRGRRGEEEKKQHCETEKEQSDREGEEQSEEKREQEKTEASRCEGNVARKPRDVSTAQTTLAGGFGVDPDNLSAIDQVS